MPELRDIVQFFISGMTMGGIYALIALGFVIIYNVTGVLNLAQGEFAMVGALLAVSFYKTGLPYPLVIILSVLAVVLLGVIMERLTINPARSRGASVITLIIITIGVGMIVRGISLIVWGTNPYSLPPFIKADTLHILGAYMRPQSFWVIGLMLLCVTLLYLFLEKTMVGIALKACVVNRLAAMLMGIKPERMSLLSFALSGGLGAIAGIVMTPLILASYDMGLMLGLKGFVAAVAGGLTSAPGAVLGGLLVGLLESFGAGIISSGYKDAFAFIILLIVLYLRPSGLFGLKGFKRV
ncbi:MAG: branched-chain amino acid ABC transporter permease [Clostridia bacterium]|nr:branched-chain amino acid ABC transporter permease [Clostridia bacterium]